MERSWGPVLVAFVLAVLAVLAWWLLGGLPWVVAGFRLSPTSPGLPVASGLDAFRMPVPLSVGSLPLLAAIGVIGGVCAGLLPIAAPRLPRKLAVIEVWVVVLIAAAVTTAVSVHRVRQHAIAGFAKDDRVLLGLALVFIGGTVLGLVAGTVAVTWHGATSVTAALVAGLVPAWVVELVAFGTGTTVDFARHAGDVLVAVVLGAGLIVSVHRTRLAVLGWPVALAVLWLTGPAVTALTYLTPMLRAGAGLPDALPGDLRATLRVFGHAVRHTHPALVPVVVALVAGLVAAVAFERSARAGRADPLPAAEEAPAG